MPASTRIETVVMLRRIATAWFSSIRQIPEEVDGLHISALFDLLMSALYAQRLRQTPEELSGAAFVHGKQIFYPYVWMCPACVSGGAEPSKAYLPGSILRNGRRYPGPQNSNRPSGRMIGDLGALCMRVIVDELLRTSEHTHAASGGGHRGEFDLILSNEQALLLCEIKASPLVAFPLAVDTSDDYEHHSWLDRQPRNLANWCLFVGAADDPFHLLQISSPNTEIWPLADIERLVGDRSVVFRLLTAWKRHLDGYRKFNTELPETRWLRFGCGNIETRDTGTGRPVQLRVDNTKTLPGIDRTDDIKKGIAQVILFGRLKRGCKARSIKTILLGNVFAETHHEHYVRPFADAELTWPGEQPVFLFDAILAFTRNIINDRTVQNLFALPNQPYEAAPLDLGVLAHDLLDDDD